MSYTFDPAALHAVAQQAAGLQLPSDELITRTVELLAEQYPDHIDAGPGRWVGSKAGGVLGKVRFLYFSPREYVVIFGTPTGTQGFSGRYRHVDIHKFLLAGQIDSSSPRTPSPCPCCCRAGTPVCSGDTHAA